MTSKYPLQHQELPKEIRSEYLDRGFSAEMLRIRDVSFDLENRLATASVGVETDFKNSYYDGKDNSFHWSAITAYRAVSQLTIGYICTELGMPKSRIGEVMQISSNMNNLAPICQDSDVSVRVEFPKYIRRGSRVLGELSFDIANRTFHGEIRFAVDLD
jgi:hypothetical protein